MFYYILYIETNIEKIVIDKQLAKIKFIIEAFQKVLTIIEKNSNKLEFKVAINAIIDINNNLKQEEVTI